MGTTQPATPPESPLESMTQIKKQPSIFRLPRILKRAQPTRSSSFVSQSSAVTAISGDARQAVPDTGDIPPMPKRLPSPFRTVAQMKAPSMLMLPASPPISPCSSNPKMTRPNLTRFFSANDAVIGRRGDGEPLAKVQGSDHRLRSVPLSVLEVKEPSIDGHLAVKWDRPGLLPSPDFHDDSIAATSSDSYFTVHDPVTGISPDEHDSIISSYFESADPKLVDSPKRLGIRPVPIRAQTSNAVPPAQEKFYDDVKIPLIVRSTIRLTNGTGRDRSSTVPNANHWIAGTMQQCEEWLQGLETDQRRCQIVETGSNAESPDVETDMKYATVIQTTRPKVVTISRRCSLAIEGENEGDESEGFEIDETVIGPRTSQEYHEISAFSPWHSPSNRDSYVTIATDVSELTMLESPAIPEQNPARRQPQRSQPPNTSSQLEEAFDPQTKSRTNLTKSSAQPSSSSRDPTLSPTQSLKSRSPSISPLDSYFSLPSSSSRTTATSMGTVHNPNSRNEDRTPGSKSNQDRSTPPDSVLKDPNFEDDIDWVLAHLTEAINSFPSSPLLLTSPVIVHLASTITSTMSSTDTPHLTLLQRIFPSTEPLLLSALSAAIVAHDFLLTANQTSQSPPLPSPQQVIPKHVLAPLPPPPSTKLTTPHTSMAAGPKRSTQLHPESFSNRVATALSSHPSETPDLEQIPAKARQRLGIQLPCTKPGRADELRMRMCVLAAGFNVIIGDLARAVVQCSQEAGIREAFTRRICETVVTGIEVGMLY